MNDHPELICTLPDKIGEDIRCLPIVEELNLASTFPQAMSVEQLIKLSGMDSGPSDEHSALVVIFVDNPAIRQFTGVGVVRAYTHKLQQRLTAEEFIELVKGKQFKDTLLALGDESIAVFIQANEQARAPTAKLKDRYSDALAILNLSFTSISKCKQINVRQLLNFSDPSEEGQLRVMIPYALVSESASRTRANKDLISRCAIPSDEAYISAAEELVQGTTSQDSFTTFCVSKSPGFKLPSDKNASLFRQLGSVPAICDLFGLPKPPSSTAPSPSPAKSDSSSFRPSKTVASQSTEFLNLPSIGLGRYSELSVQAVREATKLYREAQRGYDEITSLIDGYLCIVSQLIRESFGLLCNQEGGKMTYLSFVVQVENLWQRSLVVAKTRHTTLIRRLQAGHEAEIEAASGLSALLSCETSVVERLSTGMVRADHAALAIFRELRNSCSPVKLITIGEHASYSPPAAPTELLNTLPRPELHHLEPASKRFVNTLGELTQWCCLSDLDIEVWRERVVTLMREQLKVQFPEEGCSDKSSSSKRPPSDGDDSDPGGHSSHSSNRSKKPKAGKHSSRGRASSDRERQSSPESSKQTSSGKTASKELGFNVLAHGDTVPFVPVLAGGPVHDTSLPALEGISSHFDEMETTESGSQLPLPACQEVTSSVPMASELLQAMRNYPGDGGDTPLWSQPPGIYEPPDYETLELWTSQLSEDAKQFVLSDDKRTEELLKVHQLKMESAPSAIIKARLEGELNMYTPLKEPDIRPEQLGVFDHIRGHEKDNGLQLLFDTEAPLDPALPKALQRLLCTAHSVHRYVLLVTTQPEAFKQMRKSSYHLVLEPIFGPEAITKGSYCSKTSCQSNKTSSTYNEAIWCPLCGYFRLSDPPYVHHVARYHLDLAIACGGCFSYCAAALAPTAKGMERTCTIKSGRREKWSELGIELVEDHRSLYHHYKSCKEAGELRSYGPPAGYPVDWNPGNLSVPGFSKRRKFRMLKREELAGSHRSRAGRPC